MTSARQAGGTPYLTDGERVQAALFLTHRGIRDARTVDALLDMTNNTVGRHNAALLAENAELRAALEAAEVQVAHPKDADAHLVKARRNHRDLTSRLGFGDDISEPMADNDTIVAWFEEQGRDAAEWGEHENWRLTCIELGCPEGEDCYDHDPHLQVDNARVEVERLRDGITALTALDLRAASHVIRRVAKGQKRRPETAATLTALADALAVLNPTDPDDSDLAYSDYRDGVQPTERTET